MSGTSTSLRNYVISLISSHSGSEMVKIMGNDLSITVHLTFSPIFIWYFNYWLISIKSSDRNINYLIKSKKWDQWN